MLGMDQYELIRTAHRVCGKKISEISRETGHSRNTVKKALRGEAWAYSQREHQAAQIFLHAIKVFREAFCTFLPMCAFGYLSFSEKTPLRFL